MLSRALRAAPDPLCHLPNRKQAAAVERATGGRTRFSVDCSQVGNGEGLPGRGPAFPDAGRVILLLVVTTAAFFAISSSTPSCPDFHLHAQLAGDAELLETYLSENCSNPDIAGIRRSLGLDILFALLYGSALSYALSRWWAGAWRATNFISAGTYIAIFPWVAAALDALENVALLATIDHSSGGWEVASGAGWVSVLSWPKWILVILSLGALSLAIVGSLGFLVPESKVFKAVWSRLHKRIEARRNASQSNKVGAEKEKASAFHAALKPDGTVGICLSGGGIRSASFALGALQALEDKEILQNSDWVTSVSGGGYAASAWYMSEKRATEKVLDPNRDAPNLFQYICKNRRYLSTGAGGLPRFVLWALVFIAVNLLLLGTMIYLGSYPLGKLASSFAVQPGLACVSDDKDGRVGKTRSGVDCTEELEREARIIPWRLQRPGLVPLALALIPGAVSLFRWDPKRKKWATAAAVLVAAGLGMLLLLAVLPWVLANTTPLLKGIASLLPAEGDKAEEGTTFLTFLTGLGVTGAVIRLAMKPLAKQAPRLGGVLLAIGVILLGLLVALGAATGDPALFGHPGWVYLIVFSVFAVAYGFLNAQRWALNRLYYGRLRHTFATTTKEAERARGGDETAGLYPISRRDERAWSEYKAEGPEYIVCAAAHRKDNTTTGLPVVSFTFSQKEIGFNWTKLEEGKLKVLDCRIPSKKYVSATEPRYASVSAAVAMSGAAVTSAMGRHSMGSTNALLAALNIRLGLWMPNPVFLTKPDAPKRPKRPRLSYLIKEIFGRYDLENDPYVYVTDGGHWENLGLVELIRRRAKYIFCIDASGDEPGKFGTLREAIKLASLECDTRILIKLEDLRPDPDTGLAKTNAVVGTICYPADEESGEEKLEGRLFYVKAGITQESALEIRSFGERDKIFPRYSTGDQFLSEEQFVHLTKLGREATSSAIDQYRDVLKACERRTSNSAGGPDALGGKPVVS